ncbi:hypothetical protein PanWU01x14_211980 [Parasponia andersonii]|uniref:Uncharacterized protein n=1 Tax=Parasponia andersonii TaxID=3476 RepID=A0A2P5BT59_PARAD|nr:hypothetical protein PanWU01x14_211980 [Parasponia andersonii]
MGMAENAHEEKVGVKMEAATLKHLTEVVGPTTPGTIPLLFKRKSGGLIPAKRQLVKSLMLRYILGLAIRPGVTNRVCPFPPGEHGNGLN